MLPGNAAGDADPLARRVVDYRIRTAEKQVAGLSGSNLYSTFSFPNVMLPLSANVFAADLPASGARLLTEAPAGDG
jgi:hypothetical protein